MKMFLQNGFCRTQQKGYTLLQMIFTMAISGIILTLGFMTYSQHIAEERMKEARIAILKNSQELERFYMRNHTFKKNSTTWMPLPYTSTSHFCIRMVGLARGADPDTYTIKAVAFNPDKEPRVIKFNQNHTMLVCQTSASRCTDSNSYFSGKNGTDKNCSIVQS